MKQNSVQRILKNYRFSRILGLMAVVSWSNVTSSQVIPTISAKQLQHELDLKKNQKAELFVINVLPANICFKLFLPGSINIPLHHLDRKVMNWPRKRNIVVYCAGRNSLLGKYAYEALSKKFFCFTFGYFKVVCVIGSSKICQGLVSVGQDI